jgi:hypothetical protein
VTTIAWDGKTLAVDSRMVGGTVIRSERAEKLYRLSDGSWLAGCGQMQDVLLAVRWYNEGAKPEDKPSLSDEFAALILRGGEAYRVEEKLIEWSVNAPFAAAGSGVELALGAMAAGASAVDAVRIAARFDPGTNSTVRHTDGTEMSE